MPPTSTPIKTLVAVAELIPVGRLAHEWPELSKQLTRSMKYDPDGEVLDLLPKLMAKRLDAWKLNGGYMITETLGDPGSLRRTLWILHIAGKVPDGGESLLFRIREQLSEIEEMARTGRYRGQYLHKCAEIKAWGRKGWKRMVPDYMATSLGDGRYEFRKVL